MRGHKFVYDHSLQNPSSNRVNLVITLDENAITDTVVGRAMTSGFCFVIQLLLLVERFFLMSVSLCNVKYVF